MDYTYRQQVIIPKVARLVEAAIAACESRRGFTTKKTLQEIAELWPNWDRLTDTAIDAVERYQWSTARAIIEIIACQDLADTRKAVK